MAKYLEHGPDPTPFLAELESMCVRKQDGQIAFQGFAYDEWAMVLRSSIEFAAEYPRALRHHAVRQAVNEAARTGPIEAQAVMRSLIRIEGNYKRRTTKPFVLMTSLAVRHGVHLRTIRHEGCTLTFSPTQPSRFASHLPGDRLRRLFDHRPLPRDYTTVRIHTHARSEPEAHARASDALGLIRSVWNLRLNHRRTRLWAAGRPKPVNSILLGPHATLHHPSGKLATDTIWYEATYCAPRAATDLSNRWGDLSEFLGAVRRSLAVAPYAEALRIGLLRYGQAMDEEDHEVAAIRSWSVLEYLTGTARASYETTVKRASFVVADSIFHRRILQHLRLYRNRAVHTGADDSEKEGMLYQVKRYVEAMLMWHLRMSTQFRNWEEAMRFLDSPVDPKECERRSELLDLAAKFRA